MTMLDPREAYRLWAPSYAAETAISALDEELAATLLHGLPCTRLLDAGCGIGRRLKDAPGLAIGVDASPEMLLAGGGPMLAAADVCALPFASGAFDMVWCRLVLGHSADPVPAYHELARVCAPAAMFLSAIFIPTRRAPVIAAASATRRASCARSSITSMPCRGMKRWRTRRADVGRTARRRGRPVDPRLLRARQPPCRL